MITTLKLKAKTPLLTPNYPSRGKEEKASSQKKAFSFEKFLAFMALYTIVIFTYEGLTEKYIPQISILKLLHSHDLLLGYSIEYGPSKGIWIDLGWAGSIMMMVMMFYSVRKRVSIFRSFGSLRKWLSFHMLLGILGPILITFHTTFKFNGLVATSFWCMIITMIFGILGRYIYVQIPRNISGAELEVSDIEESVQSLSLSLDKNLGHDKLLSLMKMIDSGEEDMEKLSPPYILFLMMKMDIKNKFKLIFLKKRLRSDFQMSGKLQKEVIDQLKKRASLIRKKRLLATSHKLLHYWHVFHIPLAIVMFLIMFIHICVHFLFRSV
ncbi:MAG: hypothetical protein OEV42_09150 [Deltaproteobacteria bacterium]|nr:hypothetical protein [Deltaproteobacteria bacterium]